MAQNRQVFDLGMFGELTPTGELQIFKNSEAVYNALRVWVGSFRGEILREASRGGYVTPWLMKPMTEENTRNLREAILDGLYEDFFPSLTVRSLIVTPDYNRAIWRIELEAYAPYIRETISFDEELRRI